MIKNLSPENIGSYKCTGINSRGSESIKFEVSLKEQAVVIKAEEVSENIFGDQMRLTCTVKGFPLPKISWSNKNSVLSTTDGVDVKEVLTRSQISVVYLNQRGVEMKDDDFDRFVSSADQYYSAFSKLDGISWKFDIIFKEKSSVFSNAFVCSAENAHGQDKKEVEIKSSETLTFADGKGVEVYHTVGLSQKLDLECQIEGTPQPEIRWSFVS